MKPFVWMPGNGVDDLALERLRKHFKRPVKPMGEAWFMGAERRMFTELQGDINHLSANQLQDPLAEIASGISCFGAREEWQSWYHYLLVELLPRSHEQHISYLLESLITGFMAVYPNGIHHAPYKEFSNDVLNTLGKCMMDKQCWHGADVYTDIAIGKVLHASNNNPAQVWCWWDASGDFSSAMFFCLKYLPESLIEDWLRSVLAIASAHWRAQLIVWLVGSYDILHNVIQWPSQLYNARPEVSWEWSHCLRPDLAVSNESVAKPMAALIPEGTRLKAANLFSTYFSSALYLEWLMSIAEFPYLETELAEIPDKFEQLFVTS